MAQIALEGGLSARSLHRYFPTKADIVWGPIDVTFYGLRDRLQDIGDDVDLVTGLRDAIIATFEAHDEEDAMARVRLRLISRTPELQSNSSEPFQQWRGAIVEFVARRTGMAETDLLPSIVGTAVQATTMSALTWWAWQVERPDPAPVVSEALLALKTGFSATLTR
jgi:AcrR family transcriptional regulator